MDYNGNDDRMFEVIWVRQCLRPLYQVDTEARRYNNKTMAKLGNAKRNKWYENENQSKRK